jgi:drug/metabolite transporter (DMT)-like permease
MKSISILIGLFAGFLFGIATPFSKIILSQLNSFQLAGLLYLGAALAFLPFVIKNWRTELTALKRTGKKRYIVGTIIFGGILGPLLLMMGLKIANVTSVAIWLNLELVATAILGIFIFKDHLDRFAIIGVVLTLSAGVVISIQESSSGLLAGFFILLACIAWGFDNHFTALIDGISTQSITFIKGILGGVINLTIGLIISQGKIEFYYIPWALLLGIFSYGISIVFYVIAAQNLGATRSQILFSTAPFWGILSACIFLNEPLNMTIIIAFFLLVSGIIFTNIVSHQHEHLHQTMTHIHFHVHDDHHEHNHSNSENEHIKHSHIHEHTENRHCHKHYSDLHHRHKHQT